MTIASATVDPFIAGPAGNAQVSEFDYRVAAAAVPL